MNNNVLVFIFQQTITICIVIQKTIKWQKRQ